ncbi:IS66 family transposase [Dactylosporangium darangshiense]|uniref:IS66 family transposase n=1 Tax=Dactylosporangium darangshiense TaxID=579108 RepID=UPI003637213B
MSGSPFLAQLLERLARLDAVLAERDAEIAERDARIEALTRRVADLEALLRKDSRTSSKPPSSDGPGKPPPRSRREQSGRLPGKQPGEAGFTLRQVDRPDQVRVHRPDACGGCGSSLRRAPVTSVEARQVFDLPEVRLRVVEHRLQHRRCRCGAVTMAAVPDGVGAPAQYGPRVRAIGAYLVGYQHLPYERACETLTDLLGVGMSVGTLVTVLTRTSDRLTPFLQAVREQIAAAPVAHFDETSLRVAGANAWVHSASTETLSLFYVHASRGHDAIAAAGVLPVFAGIAVHDGYTPYRRYGAAHALCNAHHLRELAGILDTDPAQTWAAGMIRLLCEINNTTRHARTGGAHAIEDRLLAVYRRRYDTIIAAGMTANPSPAGHSARSPAANLLARLGGFATDVLRFAHDLRVPFDNSLAERDIRMVKLRQKISGGLRTFAGAETFCAIRSYLSTARKHGINALDALTSLHNGRTWLPGTS